MKFEHEDKKFLATFAFSKYINTHLSLIIPSISSTPRHTCIFLPSRRLQHSAVIVLHPSPNLLEELLLGSTLRRNRMLGSQPLQLIECILHLTWAIPTTYHVIQQRLGEARLAQRMQAHGEIHPSMRALAHVCQRTVPAAQPREAIVLVRLDVPSL